MYDNQHVRSVGSSRVGGTTKLNVHKAFTGDIMQVTDMEGWEAAAGVFSPRSFRR